MKRARRSRGRVPAICWRASRAWGAGATSARRIDDPVRSATDGRLPRWPSRPRAKASYLADPRAGQVEEMLGPLGLQAAGHVDQAQLGPPPERHPVRSSGSASATASCGGGGVVREEAALGQRQQGVQLLLGLQRPGGDFAGLLDRRLRQVLGPSLVAELAPHPRQGRGRAGPVVADVVAVEEAIVCVRGPAGRRPGRPRLARARPAKNSVRSRARNEPVSWHWAMARTSTSRASSKRSPCSNRAPRQLSAEATVAGSAPSASASP